MPWKTPHDFPHGPPQRQGELGNEASDGAVTFQKLLFMMERGTRKTANRFCHKGKQFKTVPIS